MVSFMNESKITSHDLIKAIAKRHKDDMFFTEVKDGPTQTVAHHNRIDALAIKISWTQYSITGYEVKISRSDFQRDEKWRAYLPMCNQLYFAIAPGVCEVSEIPENCGLVVLTPKGGLRTVRKAPWRDIQEPVSMYKYLMFTYINSSWYMDVKRPRYAQLYQMDKTQVFQDYLNDKTELKKIGRKVSVKLRREINDLQHKADLYDALKEDDESANKEIHRICDVLNVKSYGYSRLDNCIKAIEQLKASGGISLDTVDTVKKIKSLSEQLASSIGI